MAKESFGDTPETFDMDAWIDQATRPRRKVTIYRDWGLLEEYDTLATQLATVGEGDDETMGDEGPEAIRAQMQDVLDRMEASALTFTVQALTGAEQKDIAEAAPTKPVLDSDGKPLIVNDRPRTKVDEVALGCMMLAKAIVSPEITAEQIDRLRVKLGDGPVNPLFEAVNQLNRTGADLPAVPSSREH